MILTTTQLQDSDQLPKGETFTRTCCCESLIQLVAKEPQQVSQNIFYKGQLSPTFPLPPRYVSCTTHMGPEQLPKKGPYTLNPKPFSWTFSRLTGSCPWFSISSSQEAGSTWKLLGCCNQHPFKGARSTDMPCHFVVRSSEAL